MPTGNTLKWIVVASFALHSISGAFVALRADEASLRVVSLLMMAGWAVMAYSVATTPWNEEESDG